MSFFSASMMCADCGCLRQEVLTLEKAGIDRLHLDVMDGRFVPNFALGLGDVRHIANAASVPVEVHLMIERPSEYVAVFAEAGADIIYIHPESDYHPSTVVEKTLNAGKIPGIVLSPGTSIESVVELLNVVKKLLVMGVNPGHAGQSYLPYVDSKIHKLLSIKKEYGLEICIDGACNTERIERWSKMDVDGFVLGTAALFKHGASYAETIRDLRKRLPHKGDLRCTA